ncbi:serine hydrolase domain-containing protein [Roseibium sp. SCP14]|uniref:serine hydrolase domain-containing protein n=1 Tax=Roseibium sp. SCP14 TaxID=3141375 RepID=UPI003335AABE
MRLLKISALILILTGLSFAVAFSSGTLGLVTAGYPPALWPASAPFETVAGTPQPIPRRPIPVELDDRGNELFEASGGRALLVMHDDELALETYEERIGPGTRMNSYSLVKSLVGALILKAQAEGKIASLEDPVGIYLPGVGSDAFQMRPLRSFLTMRSGLEFEANGSDKQDRLRQVNPLGKLAKLHAHGLSGVEKSLAVAEGQEGRFSYQNVNTAVLGQVLFKVYRQPVHNLLAEKIWQPAGADDAFWLRHPEGGDVTAYCCLYATARDWARVGSYLMNNGTSRKSFLPEGLWSDYFDRSLSKQQLAGDVYGLHVRHNVLDRKNEGLQGPFTYMMGQGGQIVYMMPDRNLVVVRFGKRHALLHSTLYSVWNSLTAHKS